MAQFLLDNGVDEHREVVVCERLSYDDEKNCPVYIKRHCKQRIYLHVHYGNILEIFTL